jgi:hypothetical protein
VDRQPSQAENGGEEKRKRFHLKCSHDSWGWN